MQVAERRCVSTHRCTHRSLPPHRTVRATASGWSVDVPDGKAALSRRRAAWRRRRHRNAADAATPGLLQRHARGRARHSNPCTARPSARRTTTKSAVTGRAAGRRRPAALSRRARLRQRPRPDQHRHHRRGEDAGDRLRRQRRAAPADGDAAQRAGSHPAGAASAPGRRRLPFALDDGFNMSYLRPLRPLHRRQRAAAPAH